MSGVVPAPVEELGFDYKILEGSTPSHHASGLISADFFSRIPQHKGAVTSKNKGAYEKYQRVKPYQTNSPYQMYVSQQSYHKNKCKLKNVTLTLDDSFYT